jgi:nucleotide-binding universal stress UspA family protein
MNEDVRRDPIALRNIFHPSDFSRASEVAFVHALRLAILARAKLTILHVTPKAGNVYWSDFPGIRRTLERWRMLPAGSSPEDVARLGLRVHKIVAAHTDPVLSSIEYLRDEPTDLIVLATHQREGRTRWLQKSVAQPIARESRLMTLFVPHGVTGFVSLEDGSFALRRILIPVDREPRAQPAVEAAVAIARATAGREVSFHLVYVGREGDMPAVNLPEHEGWTWNRMVRRGDVVEQILKTSIEFPADLIVMTTRGQHGFLDGLRGSTTERVIHGSRCPLLAIPGA